MIRLVLVVLGLLLVMAASSLLVDEKGYVLIAMGDLTIESTVVSALLMAVAAIITLFIIIKALRGGFRVGRKGWNKVLFASKNRARKKFNQGIAAYLLEDYQQSEQLLGECAEASGQPLLAWLVAANAASKRGLASNSQHYLQLIAGHQEQGNRHLNATLVTINMLMQHQDYGAARQLIDKNHKLIGHDSHLLALEIELCLHENRFQVAVDYLAQARKNNDIAPDKLVHWQRNAYYGMFRQTLAQHDLTTLQAQWQGLARKLKQSEAILFAYCQVLAEQKLHGQLNTLLLPAFKKDASAEFLRQVRTLPIAKADELIQATQKHLQQDEHNTKWLQILAHLASNSRQWDMAAKAFASLFKLAAQQTDALDSKRYAEVLIQQQQLQKANEVLLTLINKSC